MAPTSFVKPEQAQAPQNPKGILALESKDSSLPSEPREGGGLDVEVEQQDAEDELHADEEEHVAQGGAPGCPGPQTRDEPEPRTGRGQPAHTRGEGANPGRPGGRTKDPGRARDTKRHPKP